LLRGTGTVIIASASRAHDQGSNPAFKESTEKFDLFQLFV
jgi:hypothetical protein